MASPEPRTGIDTFACMAIRKLQAPNKSTGRTVRTCAAFIVVVGSLLTLHAGAVSACGGFFCQNNPVDQVGERIVFTVNSDGTITSLIEWLRDNNYRVTPEMEPLLDVYVDEQFAFVAMRLLDGETSDAIKPIEITYPAKNPMIPIRLTAVAATTMPVFVWIIADEQAVPANYEHMEIANEELVF
ncbi:MAG: DUF2330 domain-containing protein [Acidimicrobiales bacterium]|jgi:hypothetical protein